jgi:thiamine biosynthesis lipoprotein
MNRVLRYLWISALFIAPAALTVLAATSATRSIPFRTRTMGTWGAVTIAATDSASVADAALASLLVFHRVDSLMSNWSDKSDVAYINREAGRAAVPVHPEVAKVIACALEVARESDGAQDITVEPLVRLWGFLGGKPRVPTQAEIDAVLPRIGSDKIRLDRSAGTIALARDDVRIDLGGIAKGYAVDEAAAVLQRVGIRDALVDLTGNMVAIGNSPGHSGWVLGVRDPSGQREHLVRVRLQDQAISTSGDYEQFVDAGGKRYGHIIDPRTGWSARGVSSVTVVSKSAMLCDAWDTGFFVLGSEAARRIAKQRDDLAIIVVEPGTNGHFLIWIEESLRASVTLDPASPDEIRFF